MSDPSSDDPYYRSIEEEFVRRRGAPLLLSPRDWKLIGEWQDAGIPLRIVLQGIHNVFDAFDRRAVTGSPARRINSLSYCRQEVLALHDVYRSLHAAEAGRPDVGAGDPARSIARHLGRLHRSVRSAMTTASAARHDTLVGTLAGAAGDLRRLRRDVKSGAAAPAEVEAALLRLDGRLLEAALGALEPGERVALDEAAEKALRDRRARMTPDAFESTRRALLGRDLRRRCGLPRLSLFDPSA